MMIMLKGLKLLLVGAMFLAIGTGVNGETILTSDGDSSTETTDERGSIARCEVKEYNGVPTLHINGVPKFCQISYSLWAVSLHGDFTEGRLVSKKRLRQADSIFGKDITNFAKSGIHIHLFTSSLGWTEKKDVYDYKPIEKQIEQILSIDPDAYLIPRINMEFLWSYGAPCHSTMYPGCQKHLTSWWHKKHPEEFIVCEDGSIIQKPSFASEVWKEDIGNALRKYIAHFKKKPYGNRIIGYNLAYGSCGEWNYYWGGSYVDFSKPMTDGFRKWLKKRYKGDLSLLRKAWGDNAVNFNNAKIPSTIERMEADLGTFINPIRNHRQSDYKHFASELIADDIIYFCKIIKEETNNNAICGAAYGGYMDASPFPCHVLFPVTVRKILNSPYVDFLGNPHSYYFRDIGTGDCSFMSVTESMKLHGKLKMNETDTRTCKSSLCQKGLFGTPENLKDSIEVLKRDFGQILCRGVGHWWGPFTSFYRHPAFWKTFKKLRKIGNLSMKYDRSYTGGIAMLVSEKSQYYQRRTNPLMYPLLYEQRGRQFGRIGTPWDLYFQGDLSHPNFPNYKVYMFLNTFYLTEKDKEEIKKKVCRDNNIVIWMYAPGFQTEEGFSLESMHKLTGIKIAYVDVVTLPSLRIINSTHPVTKGLKSKWFGYVKGSIVEPTFYVDDPKAIILGVNPEINKPAFCVKDMGNWTSIYVGAPMLTSQLLRNICKYAGVHIYLDTDDLLYANKHFIVISTKSAGKKTIKLPQKSDVYEVYDNRVIGKNIKEFTEDLPAKVTKIYLLNSGKYH